MPPPLALLLVVMSVLIAERIWPADIQGGDWRRLARNAAFGLMLIAAGPLILVIQREGWGDIAPLVDLNDWPGGVAAQFILFDLWVYLTHRAYHEIPWLWRVHAPHHLDEAMDATTSFRFHPGELVGITPATLLAFEAILAVAALFHHSNLRLPARLEVALSRLIVTPAIHWVHHHKCRTDTDANYASLLSFWDRLFGTASPTPRTPGMAIGIEGERDRSLAGLLAYPVAGAFSRTPSR
jgi:sterol desaturase/sphingolipid hydroxylase (fatty acid hydroxylase superfamily)